MLIEIFSPWSNAPEQKERVGPFFAKWNKGTWRTYVNMQDGFQADILGGDVIPTKFSVLACPFNICKRVP